MKKLWLFLLLLSVLLSGCMERIDIVEMETPKEASAEENPSFLEKKIDSEEVPFRFPVYNLNVLKPLYPNDISEAGFYSLIFESLAIYEQQRYTPLLMESYTLDPVQNELTILLKDQVYWADGHKFSADDVVFSFETFLKAKPSPYHAWLRQIFYMDEREMGNDKLKVIKVSPQEVKIQCKNLPQNVASVLLFPIFPAHVFNPGEKPFLDENQGIEPARCIGTGPFQIETMEPYNKIVLKPNENFHGGSFGIKQGEAIILRDYEANVSAFESGLLDMAFYKESNWAKLIGNKEIKIVPFESQRYLMMGFNQYSPLFSSKETGVPLKKALYALINRKAICDQIFSGKAEIANYPQVMQHNLNVNLIQWALSENVEGYMKDAGYEYQEKENRWRQRGKNINLKIGYLTYWQQDYHTAVYLKQILADRGIAAELIKYDLADTGKLKDSVDILIFSYNAGVVADDFALFKDCGLPFLNENMAASKEGLSFDMPGGKEAKRLMYETYLSNPHILPLVKPEQVMLLHARIDFDKGKLSYHPYQSFVRFKILTPEAQ